MIAKIIPLPRSYPKRKGRDGKLHSLPKKRRQPKPAAVPLDLQWEEHVINMSKFIINFDQQFTDRYGNWRSYSLSPCTIDLIKQATTALSEFQCLFKRK